MTEKRAKILMTKRLLPLLLGFIAIAIITVVIMKGQNASTKTGSESEPVISVKTITISTSQIPNEVSASGTVRPVVESRIAPKIMSNVAAVYVGEGDHVRAGQVLLRLESNDLEAQVAQARAGLAAAVAGSGRAYTAVDLQKAQTSTGIASAEAALQAAREQLSLIKAGPRKQQRAQAHLAVAQARAQFNNAEMELNRYKRLDEQDVIPKQRLDGVQTAYDIAKAQLESAQEQASLTEEGSRTQEIQAAQQQVRQAEEVLRMAKASAVQNKMSVSNARVAASQVSQAKAAVELTQTQLGYATITSPISGVVSQRMVDPGDTVSPGVSIITVQSDSNYRLEATVPESSSSSIYVGKKVNVSIGSDNRNAEGTVVVVSPTGDPISHKFVVKVELPNDVNARSGEFGRISFPVGYSRGVIIPRTALHDEGGLATLFIVDDQSRVRMQAVKTGRKINGKIEILSGIKNGDRVIVGSKGALSDGVLARIEDK